MPRYRYEANNDAGEAFRGVLTAPNATAATTQLEAQGLNVRSVALDDRQLGEAEAPMAAAVDRLMETRAAMAEPLAAYAQEVATGPRRQELASIAKLLREGDREAALTAAGDNPAAWSAVLAAAAEGAGSSGVFARFLDREAPTKALRWRYSVALAYPLVIAALCLAIIWPLSLFVLPTFSELIGDFGLQVPWSTALVLAIGRFFSGGGAFVVLGLGAVVILLWYGYPWWAPRQLRQWLGQWGLIGRANRSLVKARLANQTANLVEIGLPARPSLHILEDASNLKQTPGHVELVAGAMAYASEIDLDKAARTRLLRTLTTNYGEASAATEQWAMGLAGPVTIVVLGVVVGLTLMALFLPLVTLIEGLN